MALIFIRKEPDAPPPKSDGFSWDQWYAENKARLSVKRAKRYREDKEYREAALRRGRQQRKKKTSPDDAQGAAYTVAFNEMARKLGITVWVLREWRRKDYFPEPYHRDGRLWFKPEQFYLLGQLLAFFEAHGSRVGEAKRKALEETVTLVYSNW